MAGGEFLRFPVDGPRLGDVGVPEIADDCIFIDGRVPTGRGPKRLELGGKNDPLRRRRIVERLDAEAVARQHQAARLAVPQRERKHADRALDRGLDAP